MYNAAIFLVVTEEQLQWYKEHGIRQVPCSAFVHLLSTVLSKNTIKFLGSYK